MESLEDDAGNATIASCRASARETDVGQTEEVAAPRDTQPEPPDARTACRTPAMSDDNFDGDSVPSPAGSAQDVNTSTEAILDMIDEFVDGPGATKRLPRMPDSDEKPDFCKSLEPSETEPKQTNKVEQLLIPPTLIDSSAPTSIPQRIELTPHAEPSNSASTSSKSPPHTSLVGVDLKDDSSNQPTNNNSGVISPQPESVPELPVFDRPSSSVSTVQNTLDVECKQTERTVKCITSSDNRDSVTVERAESTSSECSVSESKELSLEPLSWSPLKRHLVRPVVSDRRPDSTVSSTVDSHSNVPAAQLTNVDVVMKDVSSSSDAVPLQHGDEKLEEISNVSEISICKAETSTAPKKIRLVRPKVTPFVSNSVKTTEVKTPDREPCQSTSPDERASLTKLSVETTTSRVEIPISQDHDRSSVPTKSVLDNVTLPKSDIPSSNKAQDNVSRIENASLTELSNQTEIHKHDVLEVPSVVQSEQPDIVKNELVSESTKTHLETQKQDDVIEALSLIQSKEPDTIPSVAQSEQPDIVKNELVSESTKTHSETQKQDDVIEALSLIQSKEPDTIPSVAQSEQPDIVKNELVSESTKTHSETQKQDDVIEALSLIQSKEPDTIPSVVQSEQPDIVKNELVSESTKTHSETQKQDDVIESLSLVQSKEPDTIPSVVQSEQPDIVKNELVSESTKTHSETQKQDDVIESLSLVQSKEPDTIETSMASESTTQLESLKQSNDPEPPSSVQSKDLAMIEPTLVSESSTTQLESLNQAAVQDAPSYLVQFKDPDTIEAPSVTKPIITQSEHLKQDDDSEEPSPLRSKDIATIIDTKLLSKSTTTQSESLKQADILEAPNLVQTKELDAIKTLASESTLIQSDTQRQVVDAASPIHYTESGTIETKLVSGSKTTQSECIKQAGAPKASSMNQSTEPEINQEPSHNRSQLKATKPIEILQKEPKLVQVQVEPPPDLDSNKSVNIRLEPQSIPMHEPNKHLQEPEIVNIKPIEMHSNKPDVKKEQELELIENLSRQLKPAENLSTKIVSVQMKPSELDQSKVQAEKSVLHESDSTELKAIKPQTTQALVKETASTDSHAVLSPDNDLLKQVQEVVQHISEPEVHRAIEDQTLSVPSELKMLESEEVKAIDIKIKIAEPAVSKSNVVQTDHIQSKSTLNSTNQLDPKTEIDEKSDDIKIDSNTHQIIPVKASPLTGSETSEKIPFLTKCTTLESEKKLPPLKLTLTRVLKSEKKHNDSSGQSTSRVVNVVENFHQHKPDSISDSALNCDSSAKADLNFCDVSVDQKKVPPIKLNLSCDYTSPSSPHKSNTIEDKLDSTKQVPKLTIKLANKQVEEMKSHIPKLTIKPIRPDDSTETSFGNQQIPNVTKLNIKPILKPQESSSADKDINNESSKTKQIPCITKLNIKAIPKPAEKINVIHRKSSSSEISESEYSENDETSTSDPSVSDQGPSDTVPKVTIKLGKPGTESEGKFYTEKNIPKLTIKGLQHGENDEKDSKLKLVISQAESPIMEKIPKLTIKTIAKSECQPLSPKLTIKPIKPESDSEIPKLLITTDAFGSSSEIKDKMPVPKLTIKAVSKTESDIIKTPKKSTIGDLTDNIPTVTKLFIKPILKPTESGASFEDLVDKVPVVSKLNIKPIVKPKDNEVDSSVEDVPKIIKLNIKPLKNPVEKSSEEKDCDENLVNMEGRSIPVVTKLNIKPIVKPKIDEVLKDSENPSSETSTSSDDNSDHIPVVTKLNIKPVVKPTEKDDTMKPTEQSIPMVTKLNIKPLVKPEGNSPSSPKRESLKSPGGSEFPSVTKLNIKPIIKPEDTMENKVQDENADKSSKNRPLVMKINMKNICDNISDQKYNNYLDGTKAPRQSMSPKIRKPSQTPDHAEPTVIDCNPGGPSLITGPHASIATNRNCLSLKDNSTCSNETNFLSAEVLNRISDGKNAIQIDVANDRNTDLVNESPISPGLLKQKKTLQNCTLLKQLLSNTKDDSERSREGGIFNCVPHSQKPEASVANCSVPSNVKTVEEIKNLSLDSVTAQKSPISDVARDLNLTSKSLRTRSIQDVRNDVQDSVMKPLEIVTDKITTQSSGQDSPRIILKINKTDHGPSSEIITEECHKPKVSPAQNHAENTHEAVQEKLSPKKHYLNSRKKSASATVSPIIGKRLRSSRVVETPEKSAAVIRRNASKRTSTSETSPSFNKESEMSVLDSKRLKLEQLLSANKSLSITPIASSFTQAQPTKPITNIKPAEKKNHSLLNNDNSKNGNSKLHNILSNLQAKQMQSLQMAESTILNKDSVITPDAESNTSTGSSDVVGEISRIENCRPEVQEMIINENSEFRDFPTPDDVSQDPLEVVVTKPVEEPVVVLASIKAVEVTPTPRKRGRPRKIPLPDGAKPPSPPTLPVTALEERPQRSLRLLRDKPVVSPRPRGGRGRGRGGRRAASPIQAPTPASDEESTETVIVIETLDEDEPQRPAITPRPAVTPRPASPEDPTSSRIKLPRMTEALDKSTACMTPLSSRRRSSNDTKMFSEPSVVIESPLKIEEYMKSPDVKGGRGRGGRGRGTPRGRTPRGRGRGRGGGKGATYMKETMGIYGRVCGPATTTVELFEEETCMMDDNATPSKPSHLLDEDSQSSVKSSTNESSNKMRKSKFADLFDSNKVWMASNVKEYTWPPHEVPNVEHQVMMIQEQVAMFLGVKSFKRRYSELKRRAVVGEEKDYCLKKGIVTEALCDLGITAVDASDVLDIMLSDYPHKYEEYRSHQRQKQLTDSLEDTDVKFDEKAIKVEIKSEKTSDKPEPPKVDPEKTRQDMAAAAIASAAEWNAMANSWRRPACVDLQSNTIHRRRAAPLAVRTHCQPPHGFYPHAILPGQYQHSYRTYTPDQLRYFPLNTVIAAPPAPPSPAESSSESEGTWADSSASSDESHPPHSAKRKKLSKSKRSSQHELGELAGPSAPEEAVDLCRVCKLRLEANRKYTHERFLVCANCNAKLHPSCLDLNADTIRKCREYPWQCAECKTCCSCQQTGQDDKMLFCDLCDRGHHIHCLGMSHVPTGRWHCLECAICKSCGARSPEGLAGGVVTGGGGASGAGPSAPAEWHHQTRRGPGGHKLYSHSLCTPCARVR